MYAFLSLLFSQTYQIPTMQNGPDLAKRFYKELTDIQVSALNIRVSSHSKHTV